MPIEDPTEIFLPHPVLRYIRVSSLGNVESCCPKNGRGTKPTTYRRLKPYPNNSGHLLVTVRHEGRKSKFLVHRLVLETFVGPCPENMEGRHVVDYDPTNNCLDNLAWGTRKQNSRDTLLHGRRPRGNTHGSAHLTEDEITEIRRRKKDGFTYVQLSREYGVHKQTIYKICKGERWSHIP